MLCFCFVIPPGIFSTGELPPGVVLGLTVDDPRLTLPIKKFKALPHVDQAQGKICPSRNGEKGNCLYLIWTVFKLHGLGC